VCADVGEVRVQQHEVQRWQQRNVGAAQRLQSRRDVHRGL
jgi:hypothetical protein